MTCNSAEVREWSHSALQTCNFKLQRQLCCFGHFLEIMNDDTLMVSGLDSLMLKGEIHVNF